MNLNIQHIHFAIDKTKLSDEAEAAEDLVIRFKEELKKYPKASGNIYVFSNLSMFAQKRRDIDLLIIGFVKDLSLHGKFQGKTKDGTQHLIEELDINSFIFNVEIKAHSKIDLRGTDYWVEYATTNTEEDVTVQAFETMNSLRNHLDANCGINPFICDMIWFRSIKRIALDQKRNNVPDNALPNIFSFKEMISTALFRANVKFYHGAYHLDTFSGGEKDVERIKKLFGSKREIRGLTKDKFELISHNSVDVNKIVSDAGNKLTIISGRAGTGKTIQLLQIAFKLASEDNNYRCLMLTYNRALVSDIQRLIDYTPMPSKVDGRTVSIRTIDSFFQSLMRETGVIQKYLNPSSYNYNELYTQELKELYRFICEKCDETDIEFLKDVSDQKIDWDFILIDEAQDFSDLEKSILFKIYGPKRLLVADGIDQFMRGNTKQVWEQGLKEEEVRKPKTLDLERRQKASIVRFVNAYAKLAKIDWEVRPNEDLPGGTIKIYPEYTTDIHIDLKKNCKNNNCENYDILILVPPSMVVHEGDDSHFKYAHLYEEYNISIFDGTCNHNRTLYPTKDQCRLFQYHSCRGLEGWCVVCQNFDELIKYQMDNYVLPEDYLGFDKDLIKKRNVLLWSLIPLTRPVDTLIITLSDPNSEVGKMLKELADTYKDSVEWHIK